MNIIKLIDGVIKKGIKLGKKIKGMPVAPLATCQEIKEQCRIRPANRKPNTGMASFDRLSKPRPPEG